MTFYLNYIKFYFPRNFLFGKYKFIDFIIIYLLYTPKILFPKEIFIWEIKNLHSKYLGREILISQENFHLGN